MQNTNNRQSNVINYKKLYNQSTYQVVYNQSTYQVVYYHLLFIGKL